MIRTALLILAALVPLAAQQRLDPTLITVLGGGISAGYSGFKIVESTQRQAWPSLVARQLGTILPLPTIRDTGPAGVLNSFRPLPGLLPLTSQTGERGLPFPIFALNLSVPFLRAGESLRMRPNPQYEGPKLIAAVEGDLKGTFVNVILGGPLLTLTKPLLLSQVEYAELLSPTVVFVELGFGDVLDAALQGDASRITPTSSFQTDYSEVAKRMAATYAKVILLTTPDPLDTAYFTASDEVARKYGLGSEELRSRFGLSPGDVITLGGLVEIGDAVRGRRRNSLSPGSVVPSAAASAVRNAVSAYNSAIQTAASANGAKVFDLAGLLRQVRSSGVRVGPYQLTGEYGGGFYSPDGLFPSATGQALIANGVLQLVNTSYGTSFAAVSAVEVAAADPAVGGTQ